MPRVSAFYGIVIRMYFSDHAPPHFHASYGGLNAKVLIENGDLIAGRLPRRARRLVREWTARHRAELLENWSKARRREPLATIDPLP